MTDILKYVIAKVCIVLLVFFFALSDSALAIEERSLSGDGSSSSGKTRRAEVPEQTATHWKLAKDYQKNRRYELARQHLLLALAACNTTELRDSLQRDLQVVDLQLRTMR